MQSSYEHADELAHYLPIFLKAYYQHQIRSLQQRIDGFEQLNWKIVYEDLQILQGEPLQVETMCNAIRYFEQLLAD